MLTTNAMRLLCRIVGHEIGPDCSRCLTFVCAKCGRRVSWDFAAADDEPDLCDDCWAERHPLAPRAPA